MSNVVHDYLILNYLFLSQMEKVEIKEALKKVEAEIEANKGIVSQNCQKKEELY